MYSYEDIKSWVAQLRDNYRKAAAEIKKDNDWKRFLANRERGPGHKCSHCNSNSWKYRSWNSGIYHERAVGRDGWLCNQCSNITWEHTDARFMASEPTWMLTSAICSIPENLIIYLTNHQSNLRKDNIKKHEEWKLEGAIKRTENELEKLLKERDLLPAIG